MDIDSVLKSHGIGVIGGSNIKNIQSIIVNILDADYYKDISINPVDLNNTVILIDVVAKTAVTELGLKFEASFKSNSQIEIRRGNSNVGDVDVYVKVIELQGIKKLQSGYSDYTAPTITINPININKSIIIYNFRYKTTATGKGMFCPMDFVDNTHIKASITYTEGTWFVIEFN